MEKGKKEERCHGEVWEKREGDRKSYELRCAGACEKGQCEKRKTKPDHHGTWIEWCACDDETRGCNIYIEHKHDGTQRIDCFTLGCGEGYECKLVEAASAESEGVKTIKWVCACVKIAD